MIFLEQACKPRIYASSKIWPTDSLTDGGEVRATSLAKKKSRMVIFWERKELPEICWWQNDQTFEEKWIMDMWSIGNISETKGATRNMLAAQWPDFKSFSDFWILHFWVSGSGAIDWGAEKNTYMRRKGPRAKTKTVLKPVKQWEQLGSMPKSKF